MPNWCENELTITGKTEDVQKLKEAVRNGDEVLDANKIIPYPEEFAILDRLATGELRAEDIPQAVMLKLTGYDLNKDGYNQGGYEWCVNNWGTKWGFVDATLAESEYKGTTTLEYTFNTAWSPPIPLIKKLGEMFPQVEIELRYFEGGAGFNGILVIKEGKVVTDKCSEYFGHRGG